MSANRKVTIKDLSLEFVIGVFFFAALAILGIFTITLSRDGLFNDKHEMVVYFKQINGLSSGDNVLARGVNVGSVKDIVLEEKRVKVILELKQPVTLYDDQKIKIGFSSVLGGKFVDLNPGESANRIANQHTFSGKASADVVAEMSEFLHVAKGMIQEFRTKLNDGEVLEKITKIVNNLDQITSNINAGKGTLGKLVKDDKLYEQASIELKKLGEMGERVAIAADEIKVLAKDIHAGKGTIGKLMVDDSIFNDLKSVMNDINAGKGTIGKLLKDEALYKTFIGAGETIQDAFKGFTSNSSIAKILHDEGKLYEDLGGFLSNIKDVSADLKDGKGTIGKLLQDESLYLEAQKVIKDVQKAVEGFREQAPISTFGSLIFGAL